LKATDKFAKKTLKDEGMGELKRPNPMKMCPPGHHVVNLWNEKGETYANEVMDRYQKAKNQKK